MRPLLRPQWVSATSGEQWQISAKARLLEADREPDPYFRFSGGQELPVTEGPLATLGGAHDATVAVSFRPWAPSGVFLHSTSSPPWVLGSDAEGRLLGCACTDPAGGVAHGPLTQTGVRSVAVLRWDAEARQLELFVDGVSGGPAVLDTVPPSAGAMVFGGFGIPFDLFGAASWDRALSDDEVAALGREFDPGAPGMAVSATAVRGSATVGETVRVRVRVTNTGDESLTGLAVSDPDLTGCDGPLAALAPGDTTSVVCEHVTTEADVPEFVDVATVDADQGGVVASNEVHVAVRQSSTLVTGTVTDGLTSAPLAGVFVAALDGDDFSFAHGAVTAADGTYAVSGLAPGDYRLYFADLSGGNVSGFRGGSTPEFVTVVAGESTPADQALPPYQGAVTGTVTDEVTGTPLAGALVAVMQHGRAVAGTTTGGDGAYRIDHLDPGEYEVVYADSSGAHAPESYGGSGTSTGLMAVTVEAGATTVADEDLAPRPVPPADHVVEGRVTDDASGGAHGGVYVFALDSADLDFVAGTLTDSDGRYSLDLPAGGHLVQALDLEAGHRSEWFDDQPMSAPIGDLTVVSGTTTADIGLTPLQGVMAGTVTAAADAAPLEGVWMLAVGPQGLAGGVTGADGSYRLEGLVHGPYLGVAIDPAEGHAVQYSGGVAQVSAAVLLPVVGGGTTTFSPALIAP